MLYWNTVGREGKAFLTNLVDNLPLPGSYLAGGTALALILGHRESVDFDWFSPVAFDPEVLYRSLAQIGRVKIADTQKGTFHGLLDGIRLTWLYYPNPLLGSLIQTTEIPGLKLASVLDIGLMKWAAVSHRGARKDFIDLYIICQKENRLESMIELLPKKYPEAEINYYHLIKSLSYFDDAEREPLPKMHMPLAWTEVKDYFLTEQKKLLQRFTG